MTNSGIATGEMGGSGPLTYVQTPPEISANPLKSLFFYIGGVSHVCIIVTFTAHQQRKMVQTPFFWVDATDDKHTQVTIKIIRNTEGDVHISTIVIFKVIKMHRLQNLEVYCI